MRPPLWLQTSTAEQFTSQASMNDVTTWYASHPVPGATTPLALALESVGTRIAWVQADLAPTCAWLRAPTAATSRR